MPLAGKGMLLTSMNIDPMHEAEFNRWYDREHLVERVAIEGFLEARRYVAHSGNPKYLCLYSTKTFDVLKGGSGKQAVDRLLRDATGCRGGHRAAPRRGPCGRRLPRWDGG